MFDNYRRNIFDRKQEYIYITLVMAQWMTSCPKKDRLNILKYTPFVFFLKKKKVTFKNYTPSPIHVHMSKRQLITEIQNQSQCIPVTLVTIFQFKKEKEKKTVDSLLQLNHSFVMDLYIISRRYYLNAFILYITKLWHCVLLFYISFETIHWWWLYF